MDGVCWEKDGEIRAAGHIRRPERRIMNAVKEFGVVGDLLILTAGLDEGT